jgi:predicted nucleic acid-binding protein
MKKSICIGIILILSLGSCITTNEPIGNTNVLSEAEKLNRYNELVSRGLQLSNVNENQSAIEVLTEAINLLPEVPIAYYRRAVTYYLWNSYPRKTDQAINDITNAIKYDPRNAVYFHLRGDLYSTKASEYPITNIGRMTLEEYTNREYSHYITNKTNAISDYSTAVRLDPTNYEHILARGAQNLFIKRWNDAINDLTVAIEIMDTKGRAYEFQFWDAYRYRGQAYYEIGEFELSNNDFRRYSELSRREYAVENYIEQKRREEESNRERRLRR